MVIPSVDNPGISLLQESPPLWKSVAGSIGSGAGNLAGTLLNFKLQKQLQADSYNNYISAARSLGATPGSIIAGLTGAGPANMPTVSTGGNPFPDLGQSLIGAQNAAANQQSVNADTSYKSMLLNYEPKKFESDAFAASARAFRDMYGVHLDSSQRNLFDQQTIELKALRPWNIAKARATFDNLLAEHDRILSEANLNNQRAATEPYQREFLQGAANFQRQSAWKSEEEAWSVQWENGIRQLGLNPNKPFFQDMLRIAFTDPETFERRCNVFANSLGNLDNTLKGSLGKYYKEVAMGAAALRMYGNYVHGNAQIVSRIIPFLF